MGRPQTVSFKTFHTYDKLHTRKANMYSGVELTILYPIKETEQYYISPEVWAYCASKFRMKKKNVTLSVDLPELKDQATIDFLEKNAWHDWVSKQIEDRDSSDMRETVKLLKRIYPNHEMVYFYELDSILSGYTWGTFTNESEKKSDQRKYYTRKYNRLNLEDYTPEIKAAYDDYRKIADDETLNRNDKYVEKQRSEAYSVYARLEEDYLYEHHCLDDMFINIGTNSVCYPVAFSDNTAEWSREKYGKLLGYAHAGDIFFVATDKKIYFEVKRHY